jgi:hypothetical protein
MKMKKVLGEVKSLEFRKVCKTVLKKDEQICICCVADCKEGLKGKKIL